MKFHVAEHNCTSDYSFEKQITIHSSCATEQHYRTTVARSAKVRGDALSRVDEKL